VIPLVANLDEDILGLAGTSTSGLGTGGMRTKLQAARMVTQAGGSVVIASGKKAGPLTRILAGEIVGTLFLARGTNQAARKRWIGLTVRPRGHFVVDAGASRALKSGKSSLLAIGITAVVGDFEKGDVVAVHDAEGNEFARGLSNYATPDADQIRGLRTDQVRAILGESAVYDEVIHKDNLVITY
jgi:glutamate 5-kinase